MDANRAAQRLRREAETPKARPIEAIICQHSFSQFYLRSYYGLCTFNMRNSTLCTCAALTVTRIQFSACTQGVLTVPPTLCYRKWSTNSASCSLLRLAQQCLYSLVIVSRNYNTYSTSDMQDVMWVEPDLTGTAVNGK